MTRAAIPSFVVTAMLGWASASAAQTAPPKPVDPHAGHAQPPSVAPAAEATPDAASPVTPIPPLTDEDRAAAFPQALHGHAVHDRAITAFVLVDQLEWQGVGGSQGFSWDTKSWIGGDRNRAWIHSEGVSNGKGLEDAEAHVMYGRSVARWWEVVAGVRQDYRPGPKQTWAAIGIKGLAPQWFEVDATLYVGEKGTTMARLEVEYELLITNRLVLQPLVELSVFGKAIPERGIGAGLSAADAGLRLRYEIRRELAPYIGILWHSKFAGTADLARALGEGVGRWRAAVGVRMWF